MNIAIIPARGGSKRIPRKNIKEFCGQPMISYAIRAARESGLFERVLVSTDDDEIAQVARTFGAEIPFIRPRELSDDFTGTSPVIVHAIEELCAQGAEPDHVCCIYATVPFLEAPTLQEGYDALIEHQKSFAFSVTTFPYPIFRALKRSDEGVEMIWPKYAATRSQDLMEAYHDAGQFYWGTREAWLSHRPIFSPDSAPVVLPRHRVQDIDTPEDWERAEWMYKAQHR